ncbi:MAG: hypothetical protein O3A00_01070, partial [Planctomycetota bacterium]|nr:hypothetical protein [Planctomycetota bacterium]
MSVTEMLGGVCECDVSQTARPLGGVSQVWIVLAFCFAFTAGTAAIAKAGEPIDNKVTRELPRLVKGIGRVQFPITCSRKLTQLYFDQGIALVHGGDVRQAERSFSQAAWIEPECAMAWWGLALANTENQSLAASYAEKAAKLQESVSRRERRWISAMVDYLNKGTVEADRRVYFTKSLDRIATEHPDDLEAKAFLVRQFLDNRRVGIPIPYTAGADALISEVLRVRPDHPMHYYRILLWEPDYPQRAAVSAQQAQRLMPSAPLVQTAAGRLFMRLSNDESAFKCFEASAAATQQRMREQRLCPGEIDGYIENMEQFITHLARNRRPFEAIALAKQLIELPICTPIVDPAVAATSTHGPRPQPRKEQVSPTATGQRLLLDVLVEFQMWDDLMTLAPSVYFESADPDIQIRRTHAQGLGYFARNNTKGLANQLQELRTLVGELAISHGSDPALQNLKYRARTYVDELAKCDERTRTEVVTDFDRPGKNRGQNSIEIAAAWEPLLAPAFALPDRNGKVISLKFCRGKPVVLVF